jgi:hypothetical protein
MEGRKRTHAEGEPVEMKENGWDPVTLKSAALVRMDKNV